MARSIKIKGLQTLLDPNSIRNYAKVQKSKKLSLITITNNVKLKVDLNDIIGFRAALNGKWDDTALNVIRKFNSKTTILIDIGANIGTTCIPAASFGYKVIAYEANPLMASYLLQNIALNPTIEITTFPFALGSTFNKSTEIFENVGNQGASSLDRNWSPGIQPATMYKTHLTTLDVSLQMITIKKKEKLIIKLDTEGYEIEVLKGAQKTIEKYRPIVLFENNPGSSALVSPIIRYLKGYLFFAVTEDLMFTRANLEKRYENVFAIHKSQFKLASEKFFFNLS
jgi:FkbM family methyltransferase